MKNFTRLVLFFVFGFIFIGNSILSAQTFIHVYYSGETDLGYIYDNEAIGFNDNIIYDYTSGTITLRDGNRVSYNVTRDGALIENRSNQEICRINANRILDPRGNEFGTLNLIDDGTWSGGVIKSWSISTPNYTLIIEGNNLNMNIHPFLALLISKNISYSGLKYKHKHHTNKSKKNNEY